MAKNFSPSEIRRVQVELLDGSNVELSQADVYEMMNRSGGGIDVQQLADGATALSGLMTTYQDARYRDDEYYARRKLAKANQAYVNELRKLPNGQALAHLSHATAGVRPEVKVRKCVTVRIKGFALHHGPKHLKRNGE